MFRLIKWIFLLVIIVGGGYGLNLMGYGLDDLKDNFLTAMIADKFNKEMVWEGEQWSDDERFSIDKPKGWEVERKGNEIIIKDPISGEEVIVLIDEDNKEKVELDSTSEEVEVKKVQVSGEEVTIINGIEGSISQAFIPLEGGGQIVVEGTGDIFKQVYERIDLTPNKPDWSLFGEETPETIRIANEIDKYLATLSPDEPSAEGAIWESEVIIRIKGQPFSFIGYGDGQSKRTLVLDVAKMEGEAPTVAGFFKSNLDKYKGDWALLGENKEAIAVLPAEVNAFKKDKVEGKWSKE